MKYRATESRYMLSILACFATLLANAALANTKIEVNNCPESHHHINVFAYRSTDAVTYVKVKLNPNQFGQVNCSTKKCNLEFKTSAQDSYELNTSYSGWWVYVKSNHKFHYGKNDSVCDQ